MNPEELRALIIEDLDLASYSKEEQDKIIDKFTENTLKRITVALVERLPEASREEFVRLGAAGDSQGTLKLLQASIPDLDAFVRAEAKDELEMFKKFQLAS